MRKKRGRAATATATSQKRHKANVAANNSHSTKHEDLNNIPDSIDITHRNSTESRLLRIPSELREQIWTYAWGHTTVHPLSTRFLGGRGTSKVTYCSCIEPRSDTENYHLTCQGASDTDEYAWKSDLLLDGRQSCSPHVCPHEASARRSCTLLPMVCKQIYHEAYKIAWSTTTFSFVESVDFEDFMRAPSIPHHLITQMGIVIDFRSLRKAWKHVLTPSTFSCLTALAGLNLIIRTSDWFSRNWRTGQFNFSRVMDRPPSNLGFLPTLIREFQHLKLQPERTTVWVVGTMAPSHSHSVSSIFANHAAQLRAPINIAGRRVVAEIIRNLLLEYKPRRTSERTRRMRIGRFVGDV